jgi:hypothetical protein
MRGEATAYARYGSYSVARPHKVRFAKSAGKVGLGNDARSPINGARKPQTRREATDGGRKERS